MEERQNTLRKMNICRFCLMETEDLSSIYTKPAKDVKQASVPLPLQIMACVAIEVFANDGMPQLICKKCRHQTEEAYNFKQTCKKSDDALKLYLATGTLIKPIVSEGNKSKSTAKQKRASESNNQEQKRIKTTSDKPEPVTLNYSLDMPTPDFVGDSCNKRDADMDSEVEGMEEVVDDSSQEHADDRINPVLKVSQVQTNVFPCTSCERSFPLQQLLDIHMRIHARERSFECDQCGRKFFTKYDLGKHVQIHNDEKPFTCVVCNKQFSRESLLHRHEKIHVDVPKYLCASCDHTFLTKEDLDLHSIKHKKKRPFACRLCNKSFVFKQGLERHEQTHADQKPHKCNYCEASFTSPIKLTRHITSHAGLRPYPCKLCGRTFLLSHHLTRHMRSHYANKSPNGAPVGQHKCDTCSMSFRRKDSLINHSAIHSMVNLKCVICNTAFETAKMVKEHITTHLSGLPYPCDNCDYSFETQEQLEEHELKHAEMEYEDQIEKEISMEAEAEAQAQAMENEEDDGEEDDDDDIDEFTITNPENPEVVRRSKREPKIKNFAQFLRDELGSDLEEEDEDPIKPVIRTEGTKVYTRRSGAGKQKEPLQGLDLPSASLDQINQSQLGSLEELGLTKQAVNALPNKRYVDMKVGDKTVRVQKLMMTKAEIEAMAKEGRIEMKGNTILLRKPAQTSPSNPPPKSSVKNISIETILDEDKAPQGPQTPIVTKTYVRKPVTEKQTEEKIENVISEQEQVQDPGEQETVVAAMD